MPTAEAPLTRNRVPRWLIPAICYAIAGLSLIWALSRFPYAQLGDHLRTMDWKLVALAVVLEIGVYFFDAWRWMVLLRPVGAPSFGLCLQSVFVGLFANDVLPARAGELLRCFLLSFESEVPLSLAVTSDVILRIMDGIWIVLLYVIVTLQVETHVVVTRVMWIFGPGVGAILAVLLWALFWRHTAHRFVRSRGWGTRVIHLLDQIHRLGRWRELGQAMALGGMVWLTQVLAIWVLSRADAFDFGLAAIAFLLIVKSVYTLVPNAPANFGVYQAATMYALGLMLVEKQNAQIFSEIMFWILSLPLAAAGAIAVAFTGSDITELHARARQHEAERKLKQAAARAEQA
jgi:uncharacterized protein (TIRG00374 family)